MELRRAIYLAVSLVASLAVAQGTPSAPPTPAKGGAPGSAAPAAAPAAPAAAAAPAGVKPDSPCKQDVEAFCSEIQPGAGRLSHCLQAHESQLSNDCRARIAELHKTAGAECKEDIQKFCASVPHARGMLAKCLEEHQNELSEACKSVHSSVRAAAGSIKPASHAAGAAAAGGTCRACAPIRYARSHRGGRRG